MGYADLNKKKVVWEARQFKGWGDILNPLAKVYLLLRIVWAQKKSCEVIVTTDWVPTTVISQSLQELCSIKSPRMLNYQIMNYCSLGKYKVRFIPTSGHNMLSTIQYIPLFYVCFCLKASYLYTLLIHNTELMAGGTVSYAWMKLI